MKNTILLCIIAGACVWSCRDDAPASGGEMWQLVAMTKSWSNEQIRGDDMEWQERFILRPDNTFIKTRMLDDSVVQNHGMWAVSEQSGQKDLVLTYKENKELIATCTAGDQEFLRFRNEGSQLVGGWVPCDGRGLTYERVPYDCAAECVATPN